MKRPLFTTAALACAALGLAIGPTITNADDPPAASPQVEQQAQQDAQTSDLAQTAYLGISTAPIEPDTRRALGLPDGTALTIRNIAPGSPADEAGLMPGDTLVRLNDQLLINDQQLTVLVRTFAPGDAVTLHILRDGEPIECAARLGGRALPNPRSIAQPPMQLQFQPMPRLGDLEALIGPFGDPGFDPFAPNMDMRDMFDQMQRRMFEQRDEMQRMMDQMRERFGEAQGQGVRSSVSLSDSTHTLQLQSNGDSRHLTVTERGGEVLFDGPVPEDGRIEGLPADVQKKVDDLLKNSRIEFRKPEPMPRQREPLPVA
jgi:membrane-associated protease RseP (regulator of RpoE activity)